MSGELLIGIAGVIASVVMFRLGQRNEKRRAREQRERELVSKAADEYVGMHRRSFSSGPNALTRIGLDLLGRDELIREAIHEMTLRSGTDPWGGHSEDVVDINLVDFFKTVREKGLNLWGTEISEVASQLRARGSTTERN